MKTYNMGDMRSVCKDFDGHCGDQICRTACFVRLTEANGKEIKPRLMHRIIETPRKFKSKLHKKMHKLEVAYDKAVGKPLLLARINRSAEALNKKIEALT